MRPRTRTSARSSRCRSWGRGWRSSSAVWRPTRGRRAGIACLCCGSTRTWRLWATPAATTRCAATREPWRRRRRLLSPSQAYVPLSFDPGEAYQFDWSHEYARLAGATTRVKAAQMRLCYSRSRAHARARSRCSWFRSSRAKARRWCSSCAPRAWPRDAHERSFRFFGGACRRGIYDNMKTAVSTVFVGKKRDYNRRFQEMCSHHLVEPSRVHARGAHDGMHARRGVGEGAGGEAGG